MEARQLITYMYDDSSILFVARKFGSRPNALSIISSSARLSQFWENLTNLAKSIKGSSIVYAARIEFSKLLS